MTVDRVGNFTPKELERAVHKATRSEMHELVRDAVKETLAQMGVDTTDPFSMQRDFQHLRDWRLAQEAMRRKGWLTLVAIVVTGLLGLLWIGLKQIIPK